MALVALPLALLQIVRNLRREAAECEFAAWYRVADDQSLILEQGYWKTVPITASLSQADGMIEAAEHL